MRGMTQGRLITYSIRTDHSVEIMVGRINISHGKPLVSTLTSSVFGGHSDQGVWMSSLGLTAAIHCPVWKTRCLFWAGGSLSTKTKSATHHWDPLTLSQTMAESEMRSVCVTVTHHSGPALECRCWLIPYRPPKFHHSRLSNLQAL